MVLLLKKNTTVLGSALAVMLVVLSSKFLGFLRQIIIASTYGAKLETDIYFLSNDFMVGVTGALTTALTTVFVTMYIESSIKKSREETNELASKMLTVFLLAGVVIVISVFALSPVIAKILAPAYKGRAMETLILYLRVFSFAFIFTAFQSIYTAILNANNSFAPGKLFGIFYNPISILAVVFFSKFFGVKTLIGAYFIANIIFTLVLKTMCRKLFKFRISFALKDESIKKLTILTGPLLLSNILIPLNNIADKSICSLLGEGVTSNYSYAFTLEQFITATLTATVGMILLSKFATYVSEGNTKMVIDTFKTAISTMIIILAYICAIACAEAKDIVSLVYFRGEFTASDVAHTSAALIGFSLGFALVAVREMYIRLHFSYQNTTLPMLANGSALVVNILLSLAFSRIIGVMGITLGTSLSVLTTVCILNKSVKKYIPEFRFRDMGKMCAKILAASVLTYISVKAFSNLLAINLVVKFALCSVLGFAVYTAALLALRCKELKEVVTSTVKSVKGRSLSAEN